MDDSRTYRAEISIVIYDEWADRPIGDTPSQIRVSFAAPDDPRTLLTRVALEEAAEAVKGAERYLAR
jgi:hypothetical protein